MRTRRAGVYSPRMRWVLPEDRVPTAWFNIAPHLPAPLQPPLHPGTREPVGPDDLAPLFPMALIGQEVSTDPWIDIPGEVLDVLRAWRPTPLVRAERLERALGTPARIYYKDESVSPAGSHKPNTAVPQAFYNKSEGTARLATETGAGQWGSALAFACSRFGLDCKVYMVRASFEQKPYRRVMMEVWGADVEPSPVDDPAHPGSLGSAISDAVRDAAGRGDTHYALGSVLNHVLLHQTIIGLEAKEQLTMAGESKPDLVIGACGGGSNFGGICLPFVPDEGVDILAAEPSSCPTLTEGRFEYDFGDTAGLTPLLSMYTPRARLRAPVDPCRRSALSRRRPDHLQSGPARADPGRRLSSGQSIRRGRAVRPDRGDDPGARDSPRHPGRGRRGPGR